MACEAAACAARDSAISIPSEWKTAPGMWRWAGGWCWQPSHAVADRRRVSASHSHPCICTCERPHSSPCLITTSTSSLSLSPSCPCFCLRPHRHPFTFRRHAAASCPCCQGPTLSLWRAPVTVPAHISCPLSPCPFVPLSPCPRHQRILPVVPALSMASLPCACRCPSMLPSAVPQEPLSCQRSQFACFHTKTRLHHTLFKTNMAMSRQTYTHTEYEKYRSQSGLPLRVST